MRSTKPNVKKWKWGGPKTQWVVDGLRDEAGKRIRKFFSSRDAANEWLSQRRPELRNQGRAALALGEGQRIDAIRAITILAPYSTTLTAAAEAFAARHELLKKTVSFAVLREEFVASKKADLMSARYVSDLKTRLAKVGQTFDSKQVAAIETHDLDDWLRALDQSPTSRVNFRKILSTAFQYAVSRGYTNENPVFKTAVVKAHTTPPGILTPKEIIAVLNTADARIVPAMAISAFAGLRDAEMGRMTWDCVDLAGGHIKVDAAIAKTSSRRLIPISSNLRHWLMPYAKNTGPIRPVPHICHPLYRDARKRGAKRLRKAGHPSTNLDNWPNNALRHSFASYRMAVHPNAAEVAEECGNSVQIMKAHYRELVNRAEGEAWFAVMPEQSAANVLSFATRQAFA